MSNTSFQDWYSQNRKTLAEKRKERYDSDPEYRAEVLARNRRYRKEGRDAPRILEGDPVTRAGKQGWRRASVAFKLGLTMSTLKRFLTTCPEPTLPGRPSAWTDKQIELMRAVLQAGSAEDETKARKALKAKW